MATETVSRAAAFTSAQLRNPETDLSLPDFCDWRVFAVPHSYGDRNVAPVYGPDTFTAGQPHDGPSYVWVGSNVTDERLMRHVTMLHERYGVSMEQLQAARAGQLVLVRIDRPANWTEPRAYYTAAEVL